MLAFGLTLIAGLATGIGGMVALLAKKTSTHFLSISLGFSAGVMLYVSMIEIFAKAQSILETALGSPKGATFTVAAFFGGMLLIGLIDKLIPGDKNPHEFKKTRDRSFAGHSSLMRTGLFTALAIAIHNFPEGLATFIAALQEPSVAIPIVVAIAIHNIPEGIAVAVPVYYATGSKSKAFLLSLVSGLAEPLGALIGFLILMPFMNEVLFGIIFAGIAGIMVFISLDELLPAAREYGEHHLSIYGLVAGMALMAVSLLLFM